MSAFGWIFITFIAAACAAFLANLPALAVGLGYAACIVVLLAVVCRASNPD